MPSENQHNAAASWTPGPWVSFAGSEEGDREVDGYHAFAIASSYKCDGYPAEVAYALDVDEAAWPGIGDVWTNARLIALAPEMAEALMDIDDSGFLDCCCGESWTGRDMHAPDCAHRYIDVAVFDRTADKLRALSRPAEEAPDDRAFDCNARGW